MWTRLAAFCSRYAIFVIGAWVIAAAAGNLLVPQLEPVAHDKSKSFFPADAAITQTVKHLGDLFGGGDTDNLDYLVLESDHPLTETERGYYDHVVAALLSDTKHVQGIVDF